eukprot:jgi/Botrbrau1/12383/Bobra.0084s0006.1
MPRSFSGSIARDGHVATAAVLTLSIALGLTLGFSLPVDPHLPRGWTRLSSILGWTSFGCWMIGWYPQIVTNWHNKSVVGLSFDNAIYNWIGFLCYSIFNCGLFFSKPIQEEYRIAHHGLDSDVRMNDVFFSLHASIMTSIGLIQICSYERGAQRVTSTCWFVMWTTVLVVLSFGIPLALSAFPNITFVKGWSPSLLSFLYILSYIKIIMTLIKYIPQLVLNYERKSTIGWNISNALTDLSGGILSLSQQGLDLAVVGDATIVTGDMAKFGLGLISIIYCFLLMFQHYVLYPNAEPSEAKYLALDSSRTSSSSNLQDEAV